MTLIPSCARPRKKLNSVAVNNTVGQKMNAIRILVFLLLATVMAAEEVAVTVLASIDSDQVATTGMKTEIKSDMPDFTITYLLGPRIRDVIGIYEGGHPSPLSTQGMRLGEVNASIAGQSVVWACWSQEVEGTTLYGAETFLRSRTTVVTLPGEKKEEFLTQFHVFIIRGDLKSLVAARKLATDVIKKGPNKIPEPTAGGVEHR